MEDLPLEIHYLIRSYLSQKDDAHWREIGHNFNQPSTIIKLHRYFDDLKIYHAFESSLLPLADSLSLITYSPHLRLEQPASFTLPYGCQSFSFLNINIWPYPKITLPENLRKLELHNVLVTSFPTTLQSLKTNQIPIGLPPDVSLEYRTSKFDLDEISRLPHENLTIRFICSCNFDCYCNREKYINKLKLRYPEVIVAIN